MKEKLAQIKAEAIKQIENSRTLEQLNEVRVSQLGKKGALTEILKGMKDVAPEDRPKVGQLVNETRAEIEKVPDDLPEYSMLQSCNNLFLLPDLRLLHIPYR